MKRSIKDPVLQVKLLPRSSLDKIAGFDGNILKVKVKSPPVDGSANKALIKLLSRRLKIAKERITIVSGRTSRLKTLRFHGIDKNSLLRNLEIKKFT